MADEDYERARREHDQADTEQADRRFAAAQRRAAGIARVVDAGEPPPPVTDPATRLYVAPDGEEAWTDPHVVVEQAAAWLDPGGLPTRVLVEEWTVHEPHYFLPTAEHLLWELNDDCSDNPELLCEDTFVDRTDRVLLAAAQGFLDVVAATIRWRQCDEHVATHTYEVAADRRITWASSART